jgi:phosphotransferase system IIB component
MAWENAGFITTSKSGNGLNIIIGGKVYNVSKAKVAELINGRVASVTVKQWDYETE